MNKKRKSLKFLTVALVLLLVVVIVLVGCGFTIFFVFPDTWDKLSNLIFPNEPGLVMGDGDLFVHFIDVGQGDSILIQFPDGKEMLIDCGNVTRSNAIGDETLKYIDEYVEDGVIEYLMLTHSDSDHVIYMDNVLEEFQVNNIYMPNIIATNDMMSEVTLDSDKVAMFTDEHGIDTVGYAEFFIAALNEPNCNIFLNEDTNDRTNDIVIKTEEYSLTFYCPTQEEYDDGNLSNAEKKNAVSPIGILEYNGFEIVFTGDSNEMNEETFVERLGSADFDVLKVGHHGSNHSSMNEFLNAIDCEYAVISSGEGNSYGHPGQEVLDRLYAQDMKIYRTDNNGNIVLKVNRSLEFITEKSYNQEENRYT